MSIGLSRGCSEFGRLQNEHWNSRCFCYNLAELSSFLGVITVRALIFSNVAAVEIL